ncbi:MAG: hypothetical protein ACXVIV_06395 [Halobacteriota archaeon]
MIPEAFREGWVDDFDEYYTLRAKALKNAHGPPPADKDIAQFKEAYADEGKGYTVEWPEANPIRRALVFWSDALYNKEQLRATVREIIPSHNEFDGVETIKLLTNLYPSAFFIPAREYSVAIYVVSTNGHPLKKPSKSELKKLKTDECYYFENGQLTERKTGTLRFWWC